MNPVNIVCLKWGTKYGPEYVNRLYKAIKRHTTVPFILHCFTEDASKLDPAITVHELPNKNLDGWWNKLYLFSKELPINGRIFFIDLDTLVVGNIDQILSYSNGFVMLRDFYKAEKDPKAINAGSGLMSYDAHIHHKMWDLFIVDAKNIVARTRPHGDQVWIQQHQPARLYWQDLFPGQVVSFKVHCTKGIPPNARIICYHGIPSIPESITNTTRAQNRTFLPAPWVAEHWKD